MDQGKDFNNIDQAKALDALVENNFDAHLASQETGYSLEVFQKLLEFFSFLKSDDGLQRNEIDADIVEKTLELITYHDKYSKKFHFDSNIEQRNFSHTRWPPLDIITAAASILLIVGVIGLVFQEKPILDGWANHSFKENLYDLDNKPNISAFGKYYFDKNIVDVVEDLSLDVDLQAFLSKKMLTRALASPYRYPLYGSKNRYLQDELLEETFENYSKFQQKYGELGLHQTVYMRDGSTKNHLFIRQKVKSPVSRKNQNVQFVDDFWWKDREGGFFDVYLRPVIAPKD